MPFTQLSRDTSMSFIKRTAAREAWEGEKPGSLHCGHAYVEYAIEHQIEKANEVFYCLRRNVAFNVKFSVKLGLYKSVKETSIYADVT